jgi:hypothetical protein
MSERRNKENIFERKGSQMIKKKTSNVVINWRNSLKTFHNIIETKMKMNDNSK